jgi:hypothetical protein
MQFIRLGIIAAACAAATPAFAIDAAQSGMDASVGVDKVWAAVGDFCGIANWHPALAGCELSEKDGAKIRTLTLKDNGGTIVEKLVDWSDGGHSYTYEILEPGPLPVANYKSTLTVMDNGSGGAAIGWVGSFDAKGASEADAKAAIEGVYKGGIDGLIAKSKGM